MSCKQPHYCVCRGQWPCVFDKPINHTTMTHKEEIREDQIREIIEQHTQRSHRNVGYGCNNESYILEMDFKSLIKAILELTEPESAHKVDPAKVIIVPPVMIREGRSKPEPTLPSESQELLWIEVAYDFSKVREYKEAYKTLQSKFHITRR